MNAVRLMPCLAVLTTIFLIQDECVDARQFAVECLKNIEGMSMCAKQPDPDVRVHPPGGMSGHVGCTMSCTLDERCRHFNYMSATPHRPCHLFYTDPTVFAVTPDCEYYYSMTGDFRIAHLIYFTYFSICYTQCKRKIKQNSNQRVKERRSWPEGSEDRNTGLGRSGGARESINKTD